LEQKPVTVVIAEDEPLMRRVVRAALDEIGCDVVGEAHDGSEVLSIITDLNPDMVLLDIRMPSQDGIQTLREIMEQRPNSHVIMLTSVDDDAAIAECLKSGAKDFLTKTMPLTDMMSSLSAHARSVQEA
jgi:DNA-binding NarL/FixJ family response regulator